MSTIKKLTYFSVVTFTNIYVRHVQMGEQNVVSLAMTLMAMHTVFEDELALVHDHGLHIKYMLV